MTSIDFSRFYCPFPSALHSNVELAEKHSTDWSKRFQVIEYDQQFDKSKYSWVAARAFPFVNEEDLKLVSDWLCWVFFLDDAYDELMDKDIQQLRTLLDELNAIVENNKVVTLPEASSLGASLSDLWSRMIQKAPPGWIERSRKVMIDYFEAAYWEAKNRKKNQKPDLKTYLEMRQYTSGCYTVFSLIEITEQLTLSEKVLDHPDFQRICYLANVTSCLMNDIFSYNKEKDLGDIYNIIFLLQDEKSLSVEEAISEAVDLHNQYVKEMIQLEENLPSFGVDMDQQVKKYIESLHYFLRGHFEWSLHDTRRYLAKTK